MNLTKLKPHEYQEVAIEQVLRDKHVLVKAGTGSGKTLVGVESVLRAESKVTLIIAPINTYTGWRKTFARQSGGNVEVRYVDRKLKANKQAHEDLAIAVPGVYFVGVELMRRQEWKGWHLDFVIWDECHRGANRKSATHKMAMTMNTEYALSLSATPWANKVEGAWAVGRWLWRKKEQVDTSFWRWGTAYLTEERDEYTYKKFGGERVPGSILKDFPSVVQMPNAYNEKPVIHEVHVKLNPTQKKHYKEMERAAITFLAENPLIAELPSTKYIRLMEMALCTPSIKKDWVRKKNPDTDEWERVWDDVVYFEDSAHSSKADAVLEIIADIQAEKLEPVLIFTHSRKFAHFLAKRLQAKGHNARQFLGGMAREEREWKLANFGKAYDVLVAVTSTLAEGVDSLTEHCAHEIWCSMSDSKVINFQAAGRLSRQGQTRTVNRWILLADDTIEVTKQQGRLQYDQQLLDESYGEVVRE